ncbi:fungal-specific transcription factor domain-domain-containing protein [Aspergillus terreus]|uniref:Fungal-specific transcription factor domain-domain-containing protein n=1 Tax=Aspergillus terreus TaxID=33178 RepID=A0A5M3ZAK5_ASPTE|nr:hypothetical protein ATETN484_0013000700 [Aspergillus terreus]GFF21842.1 fungal-specific transcription factor domain-domain-containing protein [Aspergillus terreus]
MGESRGPDNITPSPRVLQTEPSGVYPSLSEAGLSAIEMAISDGGIDLADELWELDGFVASCNLPDENAAAEQLFAPQPSQNTVAPSYHRSPQSANKPGPNRLYGVDSLASPATSNSGDMSSGIFLEKGRGNSQFFGFTSTAATIALCIRQATDTHHRLADSESLRFIMDCSPMCDEIPCPELNRHAQPQALSSTVAAQLFFEDYHAAHPILHRPKMDVLLERYICHGQQSLSPLEQSLLYLVTALAASSRPIMGSSKAVDAGNLYALALALFPHVVGTPSLDSMQILLLHVLYNIHWSKWSIAWVLCGIAVRVGQALGLHRTSPPELGLEQSQPKLRARIWAVTLILDAHLSMNQGRPPGCQQAHWDSEIFANLKVAELQWPLSEVLRWRVSLALIQQRLNLAFSSVATDEERLRYLEELDAQLIQWKEELPPEFQPEQQTILEGDAHIDIYRLHLDYFNLVQMIHWALVNHGPKAREFIAPRLRASESICLGACLALHDRWARSDHFITAMGVIYRDIAQHPEKLSARTNLEYLRVIKLHLQRMSHQHLLSASLTALFENMVKAAEEAIQDSSVDDQRDE